MKMKKYRALLLSGVLCVGLLSGCSSDSKTLTGTVYGQITDVDTDAGTVTIDLGDVETESGDAADGEDIFAGSGTSADASAMIELTGESVTVTLTEDTTLTSQAVSMNGGMGDLQGGGDMDSSGDFSGGGAGTEIPNGDGDAPEDAGTTAPEDAGEGAADADGAVPEDIPSDAGDGGKSGDEAQGGSAPDGEAPDADGTGGELPDNMEEDGSMPDNDMSGGDFAGGDMEGASGGDMEVPSGNFASGDASADAQTAETEITIEDLSEGDIISVTFDDDGNAESIVLLYDSDAAGAASEPDTGSAGGGVETSSDSGIEYTALLEITEDTQLEEESYASTGTDENTILVRSNALAVLEDLLISRTSSDSTGGDNSSFYGVGAALLTTSGTTYITDSTIETDADGGAGIFSYGDGVTYVSDTVITTQKGTSGGIHVAGGGTLYAWDLTVETNGESSAAIRSDRGSGTMVVDGGSYTSNGTGSPAVYSTAEIAVNDAELTANGSEAVCIEGLNSIYLFDCDLSGNMADDSQNDTTWTVTLYQSQSGDSEEGNSTFQMIGGALTSCNGGLFYTTNTESTFLLEDVDITASDDCEFFLMCTGNANERGWGSTGSNGADCSFTAIDQEMEGDVIWDSISQLDFYITEDSTLTGAIVDDETWAGSGGSGYCSVYIDADSSWIVTGDSTVTNLYNAGTITDAEGKTVSIVGTDGTTYVSGTGSYTITVETYSTSVDLSGASAAASWSDFEVEKPSELS